MVSRLFRNPITYLFLLSLMEILLMSYCRNIAGPFVSPIILLLLAVSIGAIPLYLFRTGKLIKREAIVPVNKNYFFYAVGIVLACFIVLLFVPRGGTINIFRNFLVDYHYSDIIPTIQVMCQRLLNHEPIYVSIEQFGYHLSTTYMPFMWLPYTIAEKFHFDYRWITLALWLIGIIIVCWVTVRSKYGVYVAALYGVLLFTLVERNSEVLGWTVEVMNGAYYSILALSFFSNNKYIKAFAITFCLLSRYSFALFVPLYFIIEWNENGLKKTINFGLITALLFGVFLVPFVGKNWIELANGFKYYSSSGLGAWSHTEMSELKVNIFNGNGFTSWIYTFKKGDIKERFEFAKTLHLALVAVTTVILGLVYYRYKDKIDHRLFLLCGLKIYFAVFYAFIQVPYVYLLTVPVMYSIGLILIINKNYLDVKETNPVPVIE